MKLISVSVIDSGIHSEWEETCTPERLSPRSVQDDVRVLEGEQESQTLVRADLRGHS